MSSTNQGGGKRRAVIGQSSWLIINQHDSILITGRLKAASKILTGSAFSWNKLTIRLPKKTDFLEWLETLRNK
jgi:hypothetical protein